MNWVDACSLLSSLLLGGATGAMFARQWSWVRMVYLCPPLALAALLGYAMRGAWVSALAWVALLAAHCWLFWRYRGEYISRHRRPLWPNHPMTR